MSVRRRMVAVLIALVFVVLGVALILQRVGEVIGWNNLVGEWWVIVVISLLILLVAFLVYGMISSRLDR